MLDCYISGTVERVSPEAPVLVLRAEEERATLGGAANVAANVAALGARVTLAGTYGTDQPGRDLEAMCIVAGVELLTELRREDVATILKQRVVSGTQQLMRIDWERPASPDVQKLDRLLARVSQMVGNGSITAVVLSDYAKGTVTSELATAVISAARAHDVPVITDPKNPRLEIYAGSTVIKPNLAEARAYAGLPETADAADLARVIHAKTEVANVVVSMAHRGVGLFRVGQPARQTSSEVVEVADVSGAGDTMIAGIAAALGAGLGIETAVSLGNVAAGIACGHFGTAVVTAAEVLSRLGGDNLGSAEPRIVEDRAELRALLDTRQRAGQRIVFANGCFDLLHRGHVSLLQEARRQGDVLVVALNSDDSVRRLKGPTRPLQPLEDRLQLMAAVRFVDYVTAFEEDTPLELLLQLRPNVIVKGGDYAAEDVVGYHEAQVWGGTVHIANLLAGRSSTGLAAAAAGQPLG
jgi:D-beta-D-heptose 7-phosphate kinase/D-beta-D-heptose 1-phosphate adenosyltransferase